MTDVDLGLDEKIAEHGWAMVHVSGHLMDAPMWTYTVGLAERESLPELITFGLDELHAADVLGAVRDRLIANPGLATGGTDLGPVDGHAGAPLLRLVDVARRWVGTYPLAALERSGPDLRLLQVVIEDAPDAPRREPVLEMAWLASQPQLDDPIDPWRFPVHPAWWWDQLGDDEVDLWVAAPITGIGQPEHRREVVPARWVGPHLAVLLEPPMLADDLNAGALVRVGDQPTGDFEITWGPSARPVHQLLHVVRPSDAVHLTYHRASTDETFDALEEVANRFPPALGTFGSQTVHVAVPPASLDSFKRAMRRLERDGHVRAAPPYHAPIGLMDHDDCAICLANRPT